MFRFFWLFTTKTAPFHRNKRGLLIDNIFLCGYYLLVAKSLLYNQFNMSYGKTLT